MLSVCYNGGQLNAPAVLQTPRGMAELVTGLRENKSDMAEPTISASFDSTRFSLGTLCRRGHNHAGTGMSVRDKTGHCRDCAALRSRQLREWHPERHKEYGKRFYQRHPEKELKRAAEYRRNNRDKIRLRDVKAYAEKREERLACARRYKDSNRQKVNEQGSLAHRLKRQTDPDYVRAIGRAYYRRNSLRINLRNRLLTAFKLYSEKGKLRSAAEYGIDFAAILRRLGPKPCDGQAWHIDHIHPLSLFDFNDPEQVRLAFAPENHQWLPAVENLRKHNKRVGGAVSI